MKKLLQKIFVRIGIVLLLILSIHIVLSLVYGPIDYKNIIQTQYKRNNAGQTIITKHVGIETYPELGDALMYFKNNWDEEEIQGFKNMPEREAVTELYFSVGTWIRNNWLRESESQNTGLVKFFNSNGVYHFDDISSIILMSLHRDLNKKSLNLDEQFEFYRNYWKEIEQCEEKRTKIAVENFEKLNINDKVLIYMPVDTSCQERYAVQYGCPKDDWTFNPENDLLINGNVVDKYHINVSSNVFIKVKIQKMNYPGTSVLGKNVKVGDTTDFSLKGLKIEKE